MTLRQTLHAAPSKTGELIDKLRSTSNHAIKTRETLLTQLEAELQLYLQLEEQHLLPALRTHPETREFVTGATKSRRELRRRLTELASAPKDQDVFLEKLAALAQSFKQHVRDERKELPAIARALGNEEASAIVTAIEDAAAEAEAARRREAREVRVEAAQERQAERRDAPAIQREVEGNADGALKKAGETLQRTTDVVQHGVRGMSTALVDQSRQIAVGTGAALSGYRETAERVVDDLRTAADVSGITGSAASEITSVWLDWLSRTAESGTRASQRLLHCHTPAQLIDVQRRFASEMMQHWLEGSQRMLQLAERSARKALRPINDRLRHQA